MQRWNQVQLLAEADPPSRTGAAVVTHFLVFSTWLAEKSPTPAAVRAATRSSYSASCFRPATVYNLLGAAIHKKDWNQFRKYVQVPGSNRWRSLQSVSKIIWLNLGLSSSQWKILELKVTGMKLKLNSCPGWQIDATAKLAARWPAWKTSRRDTHDRCLFLGDTDVLCQVCHSCALWFPSRMEIDPISRGQQQNNRCR